MKDSKTPKPQKISKKIPLDKKVTSIKKGEDQLPDHKPEKDLEKESIDGEEIISEEILSKIKEKKTDKKIDAEKGIPSDFEQIANEETRDFNSDVGKGLSKKERSNKEEPTTELQDNPFSESEEMETQEDAEAGEEPLSEDLGGETRRIWKTTLKKEKKDPFGLLGKLIDDKYEVIDFIAKGGMGTVYLARHRELDKAFAIKFIEKLPELEKKFIENFKNEAKAAAKVQHPNIVMVSDLGEIEHYYYLVMQYVKGINAGTLLAKRGRLSLSMVLKIIEGGAMGLQAVHEAGMIHRDVKPANLLISTSGQVMIADFGLVKYKETSASISGSGSIKGTPLYMSPEQVSSQLLDHRTDIYSLGATFYHLATGERPYSGATMQLLYAILNTNPIPPREHEASIPARVEEIILKMMDKDPDKRYQSMEEVLFEIHKYDYSEATEILAFESRTHRPVTMRLGTPPLPVRVPCIPGLKKSYPSFLKPLVCIITAIIFLAIITYVGYSALKSRPISDNKNVTANTHPDSATGDKHDTNTTPQDHTQIPPKDTIAPNITIFEPFGVTNSGEFKFKEKSILLNVKVNDPGKVQSVTINGEEIVSHGPVEESAFTKEIEADIGKPKIVEIKARDVSGNVSVFSFTLIRERSLPICNISYLKAIDETGKEKREFEWNEEISLDVGWEVVDVGDGGNIELTLTIGNEILTKEFLGAVKNGKEEKKLRLKLENRKFDVYTIQVCLSIGSKILKEELNFLIKEREPEFNIISCRFFNAEGNETTRFSIGEAVYLEIVWDVKYPGKDKPVRLLINSEGKQIKSVDVVVGIAQNGIDKHKILLTLFEREEGVCPILVKLLIGNTVKENSGSLQFYWRVARITLTPLETSVAPYEEVSFKAQGLSALGENIPLRAVWEASGGTISSGVYKAGGNPGKYRVKVYDPITNISAEASVTIEPPTGGYATKIEISPAYKVISVRESIQFQAKGYNQWGKIATINEKWEASGGAITTNGLYSGWDEPGKYWVRVQDIKTGISASATIEIRGPQGWFGEVLPQTLTPGKNRGEYIWKKDGSIMVYVPGGPFLQIAQGNPRTTINLPPYYIDKYEVTNDQFTEFVNSTGYTTDGEKEGWSWNWTGRNWRKISDTWKTYQPNKGHPVVAVSLKDAESYAQWLGKKLPSDTQWEKAARGGLQVPDWTGTDNKCLLVTNPIPDRLYPWGNDDPSEGGYRCNYAPTWETRSVDGYVFTASVGTFPRGRSPYGCEDMAGNVSEWLGEHYDVYGFVRGGSWIGTSYFCQIQCKSAEKADITWKTDVGFRLAYTP